MTNSSRSSTQRSLFQSSNAGRRKREESIVKQMREVTWTYLDQMETDSNFFSTSGVPVARDIQATDRVQEQEQEQEQEQNNNADGATTLSATLSATATTTATATATTANENSSANDCAKTTHIGVVVPRFEPNEIEVETTMGMGEFGTVIKVGMIRLRSRNHLERYFRVDGDDNDNDNEDDNDNDNDNEDDNDNDNDNDNDEPCSPLTGDTDSLGPETNGGLVAPRRSSFSDARSVGCRSINNADLNFYGGSDTTDRRKVSAFVPSVLMSSSRSINNSDLDLYGNAHGTITVPTTRHRHGGFPLHHHYRHHHHHHHHYHYHHPSDKPSLWLSSPTEPCVSSLGGGNSNGNGNGSTPRQRSQLQLQPQSRPRHSPGKPPRRLPDSYSSKERRRQIHTENVQTDRMLRRELAQNYCWRRRQQWKSLTRKTSSTASITRADNDSSDTLQTHGTGTETETATETATETETSGGTSSLLVMKQIRKDLYPKKRIEAAKDLAREAKLLARLQQLYCIEQRSYTESSSRRHQHQHQHQHQHNHDYHPYYKTFDNHPNLITLRGIVSDPGSPDFGLLLDRLHLTLAELATSWRKRQGIILERVKIRANHHRDHAPSFASWWSSPSERRPSWNNLFWCDTSRDSASSVLSASESASASASLVPAVGESDGPSPSANCSTIISSCPPDSLVLLGERVLALFDVAEGMRYLHHHKIVFRDLKTENVGGKRLASMPTVGDGNADDNDNDHAHAHADDNASRYLQQRMQIFDYGLAKECKPRDRVSSRPPRSARSGSKSPGESSGDSSNSGKDSAAAAAAAESAASNDYYDTYKMTGLIGTMRTMAPEVIQCLPYGLPSDVYSYGICMWEVFEGTRCSFLSAAEVCDTEQALRPRPPMKLDPRTGSVGMPIVLRHLMQRCWHEDPNKRPSFSEICHQLRSVLSELHQRSGRGEQPQQQQPPLQQPSPLLLLQQQPQPQEQPFEQPPLPQQVQWSTDVGGGNGTGNNPPRVQPARDPGWLDGAAATSDSGLVSFWCRLAAIQASGVLDK